MPAVIFDLDGTLIDSYQAHFEAWQTVSTELGHVLTEPQFKRQFGLKNEPILQELHEFAGLEVPDAAAIGALAQTKESRYRALIADCFPVMPGAIELIRALENAGWSVAIGSSAPRENIDFCVHQFDRHGVRFAAVACGCDVSHGKPAPDVFLLAAGRLAKDPAECIVVEDASAGIEAARRAGMGSIGLCSTGRAPDELAAADLVIDTFDAINLDRLEQLRLVRA